MILQLSAPLVFRTEEKILQFGWLDWSLPRQCMQCVIACTAIHLQRSTVKACSCLGTSHHTDVSEWDNKSMKYTHRLEMSSTHRCLNVWARTRMPWSSLNFSRPSLLQRRCIVTATIVSTLGGRPPSQADKESVQQISGRFEDLSAWKVSGVTKVYFAVLFVEMQ